ATAPRRGDHPGFAGTGRSSRRATRQQRIGSTSTTVVRRTASLRVTVSPRAQPRLKKGIATNVDSQMKNGFTAFASIALTGGSVRRRDTTIQRLASSAQIHTRTATAADSAA